jgi:hypothetical protein
MSEDIRKMIDKVKNFKQIINEVNLSSYSISTEKIKNNNIKLDNKKIVKGIEFELSKKANYSPNDKYNPQYYSYFYVNEKGEYPTKIYKGFKYTNIFSINLDGSISDEIYKIEKSRKEFKTEDEVLRAIDKLYSIIENRYQNATNKLDLTTIGKNYMNRIGKSMIYRFEGKEDGFEDLMDSLFINNVTSISEYKNYMLETIYFLIQNETNVSDETKQLYMGELAKKYLEIYS